MAALRIEADESATKAEELTTKVKALEQENLQKEQEITSLQHKNSMLEQEVEKLEKLHGDAKAAADDSAQHGTQNEALTRKLQLLEEEAEENDKQLRETNEKYVSLTQPPPNTITPVWIDEWRCDRIRSPIFVAYPSGFGNERLTCEIDFAKPMSRPVTMSVKSKPSKPHATSGRASTKRWLRNTPIPRRSLMTLSLRLVTFKHTTPIIIIISRILCGRGTAWLIRLAHRSHHGTCRARIYELLETDGGENATEQVRDVLKQSGAWIWGAVLSSFFSFCPIMARRWKCLELEPKAEATSSTACRLPPEITSQLTTTRHV